MEVHKIRLQSAKGPIISSNIKKFEKKKGMSYIVVRSIFLTI